MIKDDIENLKQAYKMLSRAWMAIFDSAFKQEDKRELYPLVKEIQKTSDKLLEFIKKKENEKKRNKEGKMKGKTKCPILGTDVCSKRRCIAWNETEKECVFLQSSPKALENLRWIIENEIDSYNSKRQETRRTK